MNFLSSVAPHRRVLSALVLSLIAAPLGACSCSEPPVSDTDAAVIDGASPDATDDDAGDAASRCARVHVSGWTLDFVDDVSIRYRGMLTPEAFGDPYSMHLEFLRYGDATFMGVYELASGPDSNNSTCAHCVRAHRGPDISTGFFVDRGNLELRAEPWEQTLDAAGTNLRLIEVTIGGETLMSTPVPGGRCIEIDDFEVEQTFPPQGWRCDPAEFHDGTTCDCSCGSFDLDCADPTLPVENCGADEICAARPAPGDIIRLEHVCVETCDRAAGEECGVGTCAYAEEGQVCYTRADVLDDAAIGETCDEGSFLCASVDDGDYADGFCDTVVRNDRMCRPVCHTDAECDAAAFETCQVIFGFEETATGFCGPRYPAEWTCSGGLYEDGVTCDCACGVQDPDCWNDELPMAGCDAGDICLRTGECATPPENDTCATALPLVTGTTETPGLTLGSTRGASNHIATMREMDACIEADETGPDVAYSVTLAAGDTLTVVASSDEFNLSVYLVGPGDASACDENASNCVVGADADGAGTPETITYTSTTGGTYFVIVDTFFDEYFGPFELRSSITH